MIKQNSARIGLRIGLRGFSVMLFGAAALAGRRAVNADEPVLP
jgi:hypothetical protein